MITVKIEKAVAIKPDLIRFAVIVFEIDPLGEEILHGNYEIAVDMSTFYTIETKADGENLFKLNIGELQSYIWMRITELYNTGKIAQHLENNERAVWEVDSKVI